MRSFFQQDEFKNKPHMMGFKDVADKVLAALVDYVYQQSNTATFASVFCAAIIFLGLYTQGGDNTYLYTWFGLFASVALLRSILALIFRNTKRPNILFWRNIHIVTFTFSGITWGLTGLMLLPNAAASHQMLLVLMVAGVTAGAVPFTSAIPAACILFLSCCILPFIYSIMYLDDNISQLFNFTLVLYYFYSIFLTYKNYHLISRTVILRYENDVLLGRLTDAKHQLELTNQKLVLSATHDPLTEVANRNLFRTNLEMTLKEVAQSGHHLALLYIDIDRFKQVNDTYGHEAGDKLLMAVTERLKQYLRNNDIIARMGGDEFTVILSNIKNIGDVKHIATDLCRLIAMPVSVGQQEAKVTASIGISLFPQDGKDAETLTRNADKIMYNIKARGGNNFGFCSELTTHGTT